MNKNERRRRRSTRHAGEKKLEKSKKNNESGSAEEKGSTQGSGETKRWTLMASKDETDRLSIRHSNVMTKQWPRTRGEVQIVYKGI